MERSVVKREVSLCRVAPPQSSNTVASVSLSDATLALRKQKVMHNMSQNHIDYMVIYADKEHGGNFEYLTGFIPRFEEALLVLHVSGQAYLLLGNENVKLAQYARLSNRVIHVPHFSLPNQPMDNAVSLPQLLMETGVQQAKKVGVAGWKLFTSAIEDNSQLFDIPAFIIDSLRQLLPASTTMVNATALFTGDGGARVNNNANEVAHYEYGANLASHCMLNAMNAVEIGKTEKQIGSHLACDGQPASVVMIAATGERFEQANLYPGDKVVQSGHKMSLTTGFKGGLSSRAGYAVRGADELPVAEQDYLDRVAIPYFTAIVAWLENIRIGMAGKELYALIEAVLPKQLHHWSLNPGHLVADEEWMASPIYHGSTVRLSSGMLFQIDIIPSVKGYAGVSAEETIALADPVLRAEIARDYPEVWQRIQRRRDYILNVLNIRISDDVLPMSNTVAYLRPYLLDKESALRCTDH